MQSARWRRVFLAPCLALLATPVLAHPHIFVDARLEVLFNDAGEFTGLRNHWTFDEGFSIWQTQGLDTNGDGTTSPEEMQELADENMLGLREYDYYTSAGEADVSLPLAALGDQRFVFEGGRSTLSFSLEPQGPHPIRNELEIAIADPDYYVAITFDGADAVALVNAPAGCAAILNPPREMPQDLADRLAALGPDVTRLPADLESALRGVQGTIVVSCPGSAPVPQTAAEAVAEVAEAAPTRPFGGPPPEPALPLPRDGIFGWITEMQADFYQSLTSALGALKTDFNAFWVLGGLSFLYGVFHAAGPGHGKVVIASYMLANETQLRRGVLLSFASAMVQSLVAIVLVSVAAGVLGLSSAAMGEAVHVIEIGAYGLIAGLGVWLVVRRLFNLGHAHAPAALDAHGRKPGDAHYGHDHGHDHAAHGHAHHVVTPEATGGNWREQLGVVLAVGARPCSGALVVMVFALSQGVLAAGIAAVLLMGLGTALTVAVLAGIAVSAKGLAMRLAGVRIGAAGAVLWWIELLGAVAVLAFGVVLLLATI